MKLEDLETVRILAEKRRGHARTLKMIRDGESLTITLGKGGAGVTVVPTSMALETMRANIAEDCAREIRVIDARLRELGVDDGTGPDDPAPATPGLAALAEGGA